MIDIEIQRDYRELERNLDTLQRRAIRPALNSTIGQLIRAIRTDTVRKLSKKFQIPQKHFRKRVRGYNFGVRKLGGKVWLGYRSRIRVSSVPNMTAARAQQYARWPTKVFKTKAKSGKKLFLQRTGKDRYPIEEPQVDLSEDRGITVNEAANAIFNERYKRIIARELKRRLQRRNLFDLRALNSVQELLSD